jgi:hypothetical protein
MNFSTNHKVFGYIVKCNNLQGTATLTAFEATAAAVKEG